MSSVHVTQERERFQRGEAPIHHPSFIPDPTVAATNPGYWNNTVLRQVSLLVFIISSLPDTEYFQRLLGLSQLPNLWRSITWVSFPNFYQFAGIRDNRTSNPYIDAVKGLPCLTRLSLQFHTAGLTASVWRERERIQLESTGHVEQSKELRVLRCSDVIAFYKLDDVFMLTSLTVLNLSCVDSELVRHFVKVGNALTPFRDLAAYFREGFARRGQNVQVNLSTTGVAYT